MVSFALSGSLPLRALTEIADKQIRRAIETVDGVGEVTISGGQAREIHVVLDVEKLNAHGLTVDRVRDAIVAENVEVPGGYIPQGDAELTLRTLGRLESTEQFTNIVVATTASGTPIRLRDVAAVEDTTAEARTGAFFDGQRTLVMDVRRQSGQNTVQVVEAVHAKLDSLRRALPPEVKVTVTRDDSQFIHASIASLEEHLVLGSLLASLVIMVFIRNLRVVLVASLAIPASIIASFALIRAAGFTLNSMTLLGADARRRHRHRRRDRRAGEHLPAHGRGRDAAVPGGDQRHEGSDARGRRDLGVADRHLPAGRVHDRLHASASSIRSASRWRSPSWCRCSSA